MHTDGTDIEEDDEFPEVLNPDISGSVGSMDTMSDASIK